MAKIQHNYTCEEEECNKPATIFDEDVTITYNVLPNGDFISRDEDEPVDDSGRFYCDDHYSR
jgi:hypothetical protein